MRIYAGSESEKELAFKVFNIYLDAKDIIEYNKAIIQLSHEMGLSEEILRSFRYVYYDEYATEREKNMYNEKKSFLNNKIPDYVVILDEVFELPEEKRAKYLYDKEIRLCYVKEYFTRYKKGNCKYSSLVDDFSKKYLAYIENRNKTAIVERKNDLFDEACSSYDELVELGFYNVQDYLQYVLSDPSEFKKCESKFVSYRKTINSFNPNLWDYYSMKMEENRIKTFYLMKNDIDAFLKRIQNTIYGMDNVDIIDYYMAIGMPLANFKKFCKDNVGFAGVNALFGPYLRMEQELVVEPKVDCDYAFNGKVASLDDKMNVLNFLYKNNIPYIYFNNALKKYFDGGLEQYSDKKLTLRNK